MKRAKQKWNHCYKIKILLTFEIPVDFTELWINFALQNTMFRISLTFTVWRKWNILQILQYNSQFWEKIPHSTHLNSCKQNSVF